MKKALVLVALGLYSSGLALTYDGKTLFEENCAICHGKDGGGTKKVPSLETAASISRIMLERALLKNLNTKGQPITGTQHFTKKTFKGNEGQRPSASQIRAIFDHLQELTFKKAEK